jgi:hypothetical protein
MDLRRLSARAKDLVEKRGGSESLKQDAEQLKEIAKGKGTLSDKAKAAAAALKDPGADRSGAPGVDQTAAPAAEQAEPAERARAAEKVEGEGRGKHKHAGDGRGGGGGGRRRRAREGDGDAV